MTSLSELLERVKAATGPDRELDGAIEVQARRFEAYRVGLNDQQRAIWRSNGPTVYDGSIGYEATRLSASVDAALAFAERVLPGWMYNVGNVGPDDECWACLTQPEGDCTDFGAGAPSIPLAIIAATLTALIAQEDAQ